MATQVRVGDVGELRAYGTQLAAHRENLISLAQRLSSLAEEISSTAASIKAATDQQGSNWSDPQYESLKGEVTPVAESVTATAESMRDTSSVINAKMESVQASVDYIARLVAKLEDV